MKNGKRSHIIGHMMLYVVYAVYARHAYVQYV